MNTTVKEYPIGVLEEWRNILNKAIVQSNFNLSDPDVLDISGKVDVLVLNEMQKAAK